MKVIPSIRRDFLTTHLRSQVDRIKAVLGHFEDEGDVDCGYAYGSLKEIEVNLRQIRKSCVNN